MFKKNIFSQSWKVFSISKHKSLSSILADKELASLGDAYVNLLYSLVLSKKQGKAVGKRADKIILSKALNKAGLRKFLPSRTDRHKQADAVEALLLYGWLVGKITLKEMVDIIGKDTSICEGFIKMIKIVVKKLGMAQQ
jgi:hypothetical protein